MYIYTSNVYIYIHIIYIYKRYIFYRYTDICISEYGCMMMYRDVLTTDPKNWSNQMAGSAEKATCPKEVLGRISWNIYVYINSYDFLDETLPSWWNSVIIVIWKSQGKLHALESWHPHGIPLRHSLPPVLELRLHLQLRSPGLSRFQSSAQPCVES